MAQGTDWVSREDAGAVAGLRGGSPWRTVWNMPKGRVILVAGAAAGLLAMSPTGCTSCAPYQRVGVSSKPSGAQVFADGEPVGVTPLEVRLSTEIEHAVFVKKPGYRPELVVMKRNAPEDPPPYLTPADVRVQLTRMAPRASGEAAPADPNAPVEDPLGRDLEVDVDD